MSVLPRTDERTQTETSLGASPESTALLDALAQGIPASCLSTDPDVLDSVRRDESAMTEHARAAVLVRPRTTAQVQHVMRIATQFGVGVVPQGSRTGLSGGANTRTGCIALNLSRMDQVLRVEPADRYVVVQPGVINHEVSAAVKEHGLYYPPDPGSWKISTIGGNVSTNAGGMCCVKYGVTSQYVLGLEVVLADGRVLRTGTSTVKGVAGYDLTKLFVGSEGTLGVITEITLGLRPLTEPPLSLAAVFDSTADAGAAVAAITADGVQPSLMELLDNVHLRAIEAFRPMGLPTEAAALLLAAVDTGQAGVSELARIEQLCRDAGAGEVNVATDAVEGDMLLEARRLAHPAMEARGTVMVDDICVPRSKLAQALDGVARLSAEHNVEMGVVAHAGDGNLHPIILIDHDGDGEDRARLAFDAVMQLGLDLGGTITGEHGVGVLKAPWLAAEVGEVSIDVQRSIKASFDPDGILNPGILFTGR